jgi:ATP-binding cassette, subfamily F, member 3
MSIILRHVHKTYDNNSVLEDVSVTFSMHEKVALVGENGAGKTTLLRICAGEEPVSDGSISYDTRGRVCYVAQEFLVHEYGEMTGLGYIESFGAERFHNTVKDTLKAFDFNHKLLTLPLSALSGGQQKLLALAVAFALRPAYLLIDEPENHLDIFARGTLIELMRDYRGCVVFVSHDHELINAVTSRIVEVRDCATHSYQGSYEFYLEQKTKEDAALERDHKAHDKKAEQLDKLIKRLKVWVQANPNFGKQLRARKTQLAKHNENAPAAKHTTKKAKLVVPPSDKTSKRIFVAEKLSLSRGEVTILEKIDLALFAGEQVALVGRNGTGKSTFLSAIRGTIPASDGTLRVAPTLKLGYFAQDALATLDPNATPYDVVSDVKPGISEPQVRALLASYLIDAEACKRKIGTLSGGQKTRLRFCLLFATTSDVLILDEPTNHLDPVTWEVLVEAIKQYKGALLVVSHDRLFLEQLDIRLWVCEKKTIREYYGGLSAFLKQS